MGPTIRSRVVAVAAVVLLALASCDGLVGPEGPPGAAGLGATTFTRLIYGQDVQWVSDFGLYLHIIMDSRIDTDNHAYLIEIRSSGGSGILSSLVDGHPFGLRS